MKLQIGKVYRMKSGMLARLQGVSRSIVHHRENEVRHFVEVSFHVVGAGEFDAFKVILPLDEILPHKTTDDKERIKAIVEAIVQGTLIPLTAPHAPATPP